VTNSRLMATYGGQFTLTALYRYVMNTRKLHTDDTPVKVLAPGRKKAKTGYIWTYVRDDRNAGSPEPPAV
ncbi:IS66 family transposase, partial [Escherichia coli]|nr:IS66 family transposase [Escherichia coli]